jgi:tRNA-2-methylthio-N6-dimethylallyladenosine synthase
MNRRYTRQIYLDRIKRLRSIRPDIAVTSDFIVGFPGESRADFEETLDLMKTVAFDSVFAFMYSDRDIAPASQFKNKVDEEEIKARLQQLLTTQEAITLRKNQALVGTCQEVMVEGNSTRPGLAEAIHDGPQLSGRTPGNKIANFSVGREVDPDQTPPAGQLVEVHIEKAYPHSLRGGLVQKKTSKDCPRGKDCHAA